jgi:hypothetical protein
MASRVPSYLPMTVLVVLVAKAILTRPNITLPLPIKGFLILLNESIIII